MSQLSSNQTMFKPASFFRRTASLIYDSFVVFSFLLLATAFALLCNHGQSLLPMKTFFLAYLLLSTGFFLSWFWCKSGQTIGMLAWKIKVVDKQQQPLSWRKALLRYFIAIFSLGLGGLGLLWCLIDKNKQSLHDRLAGTMIVNLSERP